jgi:hypothetical protein
MCQAACLPLQNEKKRKKETYQQNQTERLRLKKSCRCRVPSCPFVIPEYKFSGAHCRSLVPW